MSHTHEWAIDRNPTNEVVFYALAVSNARKVRRSHGVRPLGRMASK